jgi:hypothetical protein
MYETQVIFAKFHKFDIYTLESTAAVSDTKNHENTADIYFFFFLELKNLLYNS